MGDLDCHVSHAARRARQRRETRPSHARPCHPPRCAAAIPFITQEDQMTTSLPVIETKSADHDAAAALDHFVHAFEAYRDTNNTRLQEIETRLTTDVVTEDKLARIDTALDEAKQRLDRI